MYCTDVYVRRGVYLWKIPFDTCVYLSRVHHTYTTTSRKKRLCVESQEKGGDNTGRTGCVGCVWGVKLTLWPGTGPGTQTTMPSVF